MRLSQDNLRRNFPVLMQQLENLPGGLPNIHVAVVSSDMGAGDGSVGGSCDSTGGKQGIFQHTARSGCAASGLVPGATYISNIAGAANFSAASRTCSPVSPRSANPAAASSTSSRRSRALGIDGRVAPPRTRASCVPTPCWRS